MLLHQRDGKVEGGPQHAHEHEGVEALDRGPVERAPVLLRHLWGHRAVVDVPGVREEGATELAEAEDLGLSFGGSRKGCVRGGRLSSMTTMTTKE